MNFKEMPSTFEAINHESTIPEYVLEVLTQENLKPIPSKIEGNKIVCEDTDGNQYLMKQCTEAEKKVYTVVFPLIKKQDLPFNTLHLPNYRNIISINIQQEEKLESKDYIFINYYDGISFNDKWNEISPLGYGGRGLKLDMAKKVVDLIADFSMIDLSQLNDYNLSTFNFANWKDQNLPYLTDILIGRNILNQDQVDKATSILASSALFQNSKGILTNGDFYPRNLIELPNGKFTVIDWEGRQDYKTEINTTQNLEDQRTAFINFLENHVAFFFIHMWGNYGFQKSFIKNATEKFDLGQENLQAAILIKSLEQALIWPDDLSRRQAEIFVNALDINYIKDLMR